MENIQTLLDNNRAEVTNNRRVLHNSRDEPTGQALRALLNLHLNRALRSLETASGEAVVRLQGEIAAYRTLLDYQQKPEIQINK